MGGNRGYLFYRTLNENVIGKLIQDRKDVPRLLGLVSGSQLTEEERKDLNKSVGGCVNDTLDLLYGNKLRPNESELLSVFDTKAERDHPFFYFDMITAYPGLIPGMGLPHGLPSVDADIKTGMFFDHTTGLPLLPGSSVKGALRSALDVKAQSTMLPYAQEAMTDALPALGPIEKERVEGFVGEVFDCQVKGSPLPFYERDVFFDAYPITRDTNGTTLLAWDAIAWHKSDITNPLPVRTIKIPSMVTWRFSFLLHTSTTIEGFDAMAKLRLFKKIIRDWGIGAKTNVGYGNWV